jgi:hypothetical protein
LNLVNDKEEDLKENEEKVQREEETMKIQQKVDTISKMLSQFKKLREERENVSHLFYHTPLSLSLSLSLSPSSSSDTHTLFCLFPSRLLVELILFSLFNLAR